MVLAERLLLRLPKMFHLPNKSNFFGSTRFFRITLIFAEVIEGYRRCSNCRISRISKYWLHRWCSICRISRISEDILRMLWQYSICRISRMTEDVRPRFHFFSEVTQDVRSFPKVTKYQTFWMDEWYRECSSCLHFQFYNAFLGTVRSIQTPITRLRLSLE